MGNTRKPAAAKKAAAAKSTTSAKSAKAVDFDVINKKRQTLLGEIPPIKIGGKNYRLAPTIPLVVTEAFAEAAEESEGETKMRLGDMKDMLEVLFGADQWAEIRTKIDEAAVPALFSLVFTTYGESVGESSGSGQS